MHKHFNLILVIISIFVTSASSHWSYTKEQGEVYEIVDDFKGNFYDFLGIPQDASTSDIRRSYRKLSLTMHPDKNQTEGAEENFRLLVAIYEILKVKEKREIYDEVLVNGLPKSFRYIPKRMRKMSVFEFVSFTSVVATIAHYLWMIASYFERRLALEERIPQFRKKQKKMNKSEEEVEEEIRIFSNQIAPWPKWSDLLLIALPKGIFNLCMMIPRVYKQSKLIAKQKREKEEKKQKEKEELEEYQRAMKEKREKTKQARKDNIRKRHEESLINRVEKTEAPVEVMLNWQSQNGIKTQSIEELEAMYDEDEEEEEYNTRRRKKKSNQRPWTDKDQQQLCELMVKYPGGTLDRWAVIAREMDHPIATITTKAKLAKQGLGKLLQTKPTFNHENGVVKQRRNLTTSFTSSNPTEPDLKPNNVDSWNNKLQKMLEQALITYSKVEEDRWQKISECVPGKSKEECIARYRYLSEMILQKRKSKTSTDL